MKYKELKKLEVKKLHDRLADLRGKILKLRFGLVNRQVKNIREVRAVKREISQILTIINHQRHNKSETPVEAETKVEVATKESK